MGYEAPGSSMNKRLSNVSEEGELDDDNNNNQQTTNNRQQTTDNRQTTTTTTTTTECICLSFSQILIGLVVHIHARVLRQAYFV